MSDSDHNLISDNDSDDYLDDEAFFEVSFVFLYLLCRKIQNMLVSYLN